MGCCKICESTLEIAYADMSQGPTIPYASSFVCEHDMLVRTFAPLSPFAYRKPGGEWHRIDNGLILKTLAEKAS
jgi:hypothetical protein